MFDRSRWSVLVLSSLFLSTAVSTSEAQTVAYHTHGTGRFSRARPDCEPLRVVAINDPFTFLDPEWEFSWELTGRIRLR